MRRTHLLSLAILVSLSSSFAQPELKRNDFVVGRIAIDSSVGSALPYLAKPLRIDSLFDEEVGGFTVYHFTGLTIWAETHSGKISSFDVSSKAFSTQRGLHAGDSVNKLVRLYGKRPSEKQLNRLHDNYDTSFKDFTELKIYEYRKPNEPVLYAVFYIKNSKVIKIYMCMGLGC